MSQTTTPQEITVYQRVSSIIQSTISDSRPCGKTTLIGYGRNTVVTVSMKDLVQTIEKTHGPDAAYSILQELGINYDPGMRASRTQTWDEYHV